MLRFVDDSNGQTNAFLENDQPSAAALESMMCDDAHLWNNILPVSGGSLELSKCSYHILHWLFKKDGAPFLTPGQISEPINVL
jgi:hypothetical protein